jgi:2-methylcitrate dehydratase PrpD
MENEVAAQPTVSRRLADWVVGLRFEHLPSEVVDRAALLILDNLGVQVRGTTLPNVQPERALAAALGGRPEAMTVLGGRLSAPQAAWVNGTLGHSAEFDDAHMAAWHTASAVVPAALALAEREGSSGRDVLRSVVAGVQVMGLLGSVAGRGMLTAGWHGSKVLGVFGSAAASGALLGLTAAELAHAFGIAASDAGGTMEYDRAGGEVKRLHGGSSSRTGVEAALLARAGLTGPSTIFEGHRGIFAMFGGAHDCSALDAVWNEWQVLGTIFRFYPAVAATHSPLDALRALRAAHNFDARDVVEIRIGLPAWAVSHGAAITRPTDAISAQFSLAFGIGLQLTTGRNAPEDYFDPARWTDPRVLAIADLVQPYAIEIPAGDPNLSSRAEIVLRDGRRLEHYQPGFHGHPVWPATTDDIVTKFRDNAGGILSPAATDGVVAATLGLAKAANVRRLTDLLAAPEEA